jgi:hypothetical protein
MSKKNHKHHPTQPNEKRPSGPAPAGSSMADQDDDSPVTEVRETLREGLSAGMESARGAVSSAKDAVANAAVSAKEAALNAAESAKDAARTAADRMETMAHDAQEAIVDAGQAVVETARKNPLPLALAGFGVACAGVGITLLVLNAREDARKPSQPSGRRRQGQQGQQRGAQLGAGSGNGQQQQSARTTASVGSSLQRTLGNVGDEASRIAQRAQSSIGEATRTAGQALGKVVEEAKVQGRRAGTALEETYESNPLAVGAAVLAAGTILGLALPSTRREDEWLGEGRDQVVSKAKDLAKDAMEKVDRIIHPST